MRGKQCFLLARQVGGRPGELMFCCCYFLSFSSFFSFLTIAWSKEISQPTRSTFTKFSGLIERWLYMFNLVFVSRSFKGRCHGNQFYAPNRPKSATRLPSWDLHSTTDGRMAKQMDTLTPLMSSPYCIKIGELWFTNPGVYYAHLATILGSKWAKSAKCLPHGCIS